MGEDLEEIRAKAEVSVGLVRKLVASWLPEPSPDEKIEKLRTPKSVTALYSSDPVQAQRTLQLKKKISGIKSHPEGVESATGSTTPSNGLGHLSKGKGATKRDEAEDEEEALLHKISSTSKTIKKPTDILSSYLDKDRAGKRKRKKKKNKGASAVQS